MHGSERNRREKLKTVLPLAARDMEQAAAAARALYEDEREDEAFRRALETAMAVCYMRPFTRSTWLTLPQEYIAKRGSVDLGFHMALHDLRDQTHAHTDTKGDDANDGREGRHR